MVLLKLYASFPFVAWLAIVHGTCYFEQYLDGRTQTSNTAYVQWRVNLNTPSTSSCNVINRYKQQGVLEIITPQNATKTIIRLHQEGETCFASWHLAMDWTDGYGGQNAELHTAGSNLLAFGRYPGPGPAQRPPGIYINDFVSKTAATKVDVSVYKAPAPPGHTGWVDQYNIVDKVFPPCDTQEVKYIDQNMFRIDDMKANGVYLGLNRVVNGRSGREGAGLYYVCVEFQ